MKISSKDFQVAPSKKVELDRWPTIVQSFDLKMAYPKSTPKRLRELQAIGKRLAKSDN